MSDLINILFLGDVVGRPGRRAVKEFLGKIENDFESIKNQGLMEVKPDFVIVNVENASHGFGLTRKNHNEFSELPIDLLTSGNHIWDKKEIFEYIEYSEKLIRPLNYPETVPGVGYRIVEKDGVKMAVINLLGKVFMPDIDSPWDALEKVLPLIKEQTDILIIDYLGVSGFFGTHTHVQTADEKILKNGCAYITDAGFCGSSNAVIGMEFENSYKRLRTYLPDRFDVADLDLTEVNGVFVSIDKNTSCASHIKRIKYVVDFKKEKENMEG